MRRNSTIEILGGGPAGLYAAILVRRLMPHVRVRVTEQNPRGATFGFGVVFSDRALEFLQADDPETHAAISPAMERWRNMVLHHPQGAVTIDGVGFSAIGRLELLEILCTRAEVLGAAIRFSHPVRHLDELDGDLIVGADGLNSLVRRSDEASLRSARGALRQPLCLVRNAARVRYPEPDVRTHREGGAQRPPLPLRARDEHLHRRMFARHVRTVRVRGTWTRPRAPVRAGRSLPKSFRGRRW